MASVQTLTTYDQIWKVAYCRAVTSKQGYELVTSAVQYIIVPLTAFRADTRKYILGPLLTSLEALSVQCGYSPTGTPRLSYTLYRATFCSTT
jgi:hypothetical protein